MLSVAAAKPGPFVFPAHGAALIVIDMQRDFLEPGGFGAALGNDVARLAPAIEPAGRLLESFRRLGLPVFHTREAHRPDLSDCPPSKRARGRIGEPGPMGRILVAGEPGTEIIAPLAPLDGEPVLDKPGKGAFHATALESLLRARGVSHLILAGVTTEVCVQTTMREATDRGFVCLLAEDATESYFPEFKAATLEMITAQGAIVGWTAPVGAILSELETIQARAPIALLRRPGLLDPASRAGLAFEPFRPGVEAHWLYRTPDGGPAAALLRYAPGARVPFHHHAGFEHVLILEGCQTDPGGPCPAGTLVVNPPGTAHAVASEAGCLALLIWERAPIIEG